MTSFAGIRRHCSCCHFWLYFDENRHFWRPRRPRSNTRATSLQASRRHRVQRRFRHRRVGWRRWNCWVLVRPYVYTNVSSSHIRLRYHFKEKPTDVLACTIASHHYIGIFNYRSGLKGDFEFPEKRLMFSSKMDSDLFEFVKHKTHVLSLAVSPDGKMFAATSSDKKIRVFRFISGKPSFIAVH